MIHFLLLLVCVLSVEVFIRLNFLSILESILNVITKVTYVIFQNKISYHWKEKVIPVYAFRIMMHSLKILLILLIIISFVGVTALYFNNFLSLVISLIGAIESMIFVFGYAYLRKAFTK